MYLTTFFSKGDGTFSVVQQLTTGLGGSFPAYGVTNSWVGDYSGDGKSEVMDPRNNKIYTYNPSARIPILLRTSPTPLAVQT
jgi:hypothetical protein